MSITKTPDKWDEASKRWVAGDKDEVSYVGQVMEVYHCDYRAMSDVYTWATFAKVVTEDGSPVEVMVNANFECDLSGGRATVDLDDKHRALYGLWQARQEVLREAKELSRQAKRFEAERNRPVVGKPMKVVKGRKVPVGTLGTVAYIHANGGILLKDDAVWQDKRANGVWVNPGNLAAR